MTGRWRAAALVGAVLAVYAPRLNGPYLWDDRKFLIEQEFPRRPDAVEILFRSREYLQRWPEWPGYRPLNALTHIVDFRVWGDRRWGHRLTNVIIHSANSLLLWRLGLSLTGAPGAAWAAAGLFALHPAVTETIYCAYLRTDALAALAVLSVLLLWRTKPGWAVAIYAAGLLVKETVGLLPILLWLDPRGNTAGRPEGRPLRTTRPGTAPGSSYEVRRRVLPYVVVAGVYLLFRLGVVFRPIIGDVPRPWTVGFPENLAVAAAAAVEDWRILLWPAHLSVDHPVRFSGWGNPDVWAGAAIWATLAMGAGWLMWRADLKVGPYGGFKRVAGFGLALAGLMRLPSAHLLPRMETVVAAERYLYLPLAGVCLAVAAGVAAAGRRADLKVGPYVLVAVALLGGMRAAARGADWQSAERLFASARTAHPDSTRAMIGLAVDRHQQSRFDEAETLYRDILAREPWWPVVYNNLALILWRRHDWPGAESCFVEALKWQPDDARLRKNLAWTRAQMAKRRAA